jgi:hypothetical protein
MSRKGMRKTPLEEREGIIGKKCSKCMVWKPLCSFYNSSGGTGGKHSRCNDCQIEIQKSYWEEAKRKLGGLKPYLKVNYGMRNGEFGKECTECKEWKTLNEYYDFSKKGKGVGGKRSKCIQCVKNRGKVTNKIWHEKNKEYKNSKCREWSAKNKGWETERSRNWARANPDKVSIFYQKRQARKKYLPNTLTDEEYSRALEYFGNACALTGRTSNLEMEHAVPMSIGHGGTTFGNCYPMSKGINQSKWKNNIFEWFEANRQRFELSQERFDKLIEWLASANAMTVEEYRDYVYWCHANPRSDDELRAEYERRNEEAM